MKMALFDSAVLFTYATDEEMKAKLSEDFRFYALAISIQMIWNNDFKRHIMKWLTLWIDIKFELSHRVLTGRFLVVTTDKETFSVNYNQAHFEEIIYNNNKRYKRSVDLTDSITSPGIRVDAVLFFLLAIKYYVIKCVQFTLHLAGFCRTFLAMCIDQ